jgi:hypothetical protein
MKCEHNARNSPCTSHGGIAMQNELLDHKVDTRRECGKS